MAIASRAWSTFPTDGAESLGRTVIKKRLQQEGRDLLELVLLPMGAALLPWSWAFRLFKYLAKRDFLYRDATERALLEARRWKWVREGSAEEQHWRWIRRLTTLIDHADLYLSLTRSDRWMRHHLRVEGEWPRHDQAAICCTFHWGAGMWALRHAHSSGLSPAALVAALQGAHFKGRFVLHLYARLRTWAVKRALHQDTVDVSHSLRPAIQILRSSGQVMAAVDVPSDQVASSEAVQIVGIEARVPNALFRLATERHLPLWVYSTGFSVSDGRRLLRLKRMDTLDDPSPLPGRVFDELSQLIGESPASWHFWSEAPRFFGSPDVS